MSNQIRDEFEEWAAEEAEVRGVGTLLGLMKDEHHDRYSMIWTQTAWLAWQASRGAVMVELPPPYPEPEEPEETIDDSHMDAFHAANGMRHACSKAIEAAGLKVTP